MHTIAERLKWARGHSKLSQQELSGLADLSASHVGFIEQERFKSVHVNTAAAVARVLGVSTEWLLLGTDPVPEPETIFAAATAAKASRKDVA